MGLERYSPRLTFDCATGKQFDVAPTEEWVLTNYPDYVMITADKVLIVADGVDAATVTMRLYDPLDRAKAADVIATLTVDGQTVEVPLVGGVGTSEVSSYEAKTITVTPQTPGGTSIEVVAT